MLTVSLLVSTLAAAPAALRPRDCPACGVYAGPNAARVLDPYLRQPNIWPEFDSASCRFEVTLSRFVTLSRDACSAEATYRAGNMRPRAGA